LTALWCDLLCARNSTLKHAELLPSSLRAAPAVSKTSPVTVTVKGQVQNFCGDDDVTAADSSGCSTPTPSTTNQQQQQVQQKFYQERFDYEIDPDIGVIV